MPFQLNSAGLPVAAAAASNSQGAERGGRGSQGAERSGRGSQGAERGGRGRQGAERGGRGSQGAVTERRAPSCKFRSRRGEPVTGIDGAASIGQRRTITARCMSASATNVSHGTRDMGCFCNGEGYCGHGDLVLGHVDRLHAVPRPRSTPHKDRPAGPRRNRTGAGQSHRQ